MSGPGFWPCWAWKIRDERPTTLEYTAAELWVRTQYQSWFAAQAAGRPNLVTWQLDRFFSSYDTGDDVLGLVMEVMDSDFRNVFSHSFVRRFTKLMNGRGTPGDLLRLLAEAAPGGALKPDMLGIVNDGTRVLFDAVEVGTVKTAKSTYDELHMKLNTLRTSVIPVVQLRLPLLQAQRRKSLTPNFEVRASPFRLEEWAKIMPLPVRIGKEGSVTTADWICFHPTDSDVSGAAPTPDRMGADGLVVYHIHRAEVGKLPRRVQQHAERQLEQWKQQRGLVLELNPAMAGAMRDSTSDWTPEGRRMLAYAGVAGLAILLLAAAWEVGVIEGAAVLAEKGLEAAAGTPAALRGALQLTSEFTQRLWPLATGAAPLVPALGH